MSRRHFLKVPGQPLARTAAYFSGSQTAIAPGARLAQA
jgi:hypothetical protein